MRPVPTRAWLHHRYVGQGNSAEQIARECGWSAQYVRDRLRGYGIALRPPGGASRGGQGLDRDTLSRWLEQAMTVTQIADRSGYSRSGVYKLITQHRLTVQASVTATGAGAESPHVLSECARLYRDGQSLHEIGARFGRGQQWARARVTAAGVPVRHGGRQRRSGRADELREALAHGHNTTEIAAQLGRSPTTIRQWLRQAGIPPPPPRRPRGPRLPPLDPGVLHALYVQQRHAVTAIAAELRVSPDRVRAGLDAAGIAQRSSRGEESRKRLATLTGAQLREMYLARGRSAAHIAGELGCSRGQVDAALRLHDIPRRRPGASPAPPLLLDRDTLRVLYVTQRLEDAEIGARYWVPAHRVRLRRRALGVARPPAAPPHPPLPSPPPADQLARLYLTERRTLAQIGRRYHTSSRGVRRWLLQAGIPVRARTSRAHRKHLDVAVLRTLYTDREWTAAQIAHELDSTIHLVLRSLHENAIPVRTGGPPRRLECPDSEQLLTALYTDPDVTALLTAHHVPRRPDPGSVTDRFPTPAPLTAALLREAYTGIGLAARHIELLTGQPAGQILDTLHALEITVRRSGLSPWLVRQRHHLPRQRQPARPSPRR